ncbi:MAG: putative photosynthetic complex assembly protein PuhE [Pseudomonadota bacterium]
MTEILLAIGLVVFAWWFSTGAILILARLSGRVGQSATAAFSMVAGGAMVAVWALRDDMSIVGTAGAFGAALAVWGWHELMFLRGTITGPRRTALPAGLSGRARFATAWQCLAHHELALVATLGALIALTYGAENQTAAATFAVLWAMRVSAKLNIFAGVPSAAEEFLPPHLAYLKSYFRIGKASWLMPVSIGASSCVLLAMVISILATATGASGAFDAGAALAIDGSLNAPLNVPLDGALFGACLVATTLALGILEHLMLVLPLSETALWRWAMSPFSGNGPKGQRPVPTGATLVCAQPQPAPRHV